MQKLHSLHRVHRVSALNLNTAKKIANENKFDKDFIPIIDIDYSLVGKKSEYAYNGFIILDSNEVTQLSNYLDPNKNKQNLKIIKLFKDDVFIPFKISKGNKNANDEDGIIEIVSNGINVITKKTINVEYDETIAIKISIKNLKQNATIDFYASDDGGFFDSRGLQNIFCGKVKFITGSSKVGLQLTTNIEKLPLAPIDYISPPTFTEPKKSFDVANKYQNCGGMCFAVTMARVSQAYKNTLGFGILKVESSGQDYIYSGTISKDIPEIYFGYGVGGALASKGYADLIDHNDVLNGLLNEGALLQYWNNYNDVSWELLKKAIKNSLSNIVDSNFHGGHSVIFKSYIFDENGKIDGMKFYDYQGIERHFNSNEKKIFKGANLRDAKK